MWALGAAIVSNGGRWMKNDDYSDWVEIKKYFLIFKVRVSHLPAKDNRFNLDLFRHVKTTY
jgi:hypothetical protein